MVDKKSTGGTNLRQKLLNSFDIDYLSEVDGRRYKGKFLAKKLSIRDIAALGVRKSQLNGGMHHDAEHPGHGVDEQTDEFNNMIAHLEISVVEKPQWWNLDEITDVALIGQVYAEVLAFENKFLGRRSGADDPESGDDGSGEMGGADDSHGSLPVGDSTEVVDREVQASLEP
jgi:hypothetical protein